MLAIISVLPLGKGGSLSKDVSEAVSLIDKSGLDYQLTAMGTLVEGGWDEVMKLLKRLRDLGLRRAGRVYITVSIDERGGTERRMVRKVAAVESRLGRPLKK